MEEHYVVRDPYTVVRGEFLGKWLVVGRTFDGVRAIGRQVHFDGVTPGVVHRTIHDEHLRHYPKDENTSLQSFFTGLKEEMLTHGATALAVQWVMEMEPAPFSEKELNIMSEKLKGKAKPAAKTTKAAAPKADKPARKGNPEALAKAREAKSAGREANRSKKIKVLNKNHGARAGTNRANMLDIVIKAKTVGDAIDGGATMVDVRFAEKQGFIELN